MRRAISLALLCVSSSAFAAQDVALDCRHLRIALDPRMTPVMVEKDWGSGVFHEASPASVELVACDGRLLDRYALEAPLARIDPLSVRGAPYPTYLVSADLTVEAGSYNGPLTILLQVVQDRLTVATVEDPGGRVQPIHLAVTGKAAWRRRAAAGGDDFLQVVARPTSAGFVTDYRRFFVERKSWKQEVRVRPGPWEPDGDFPAANRFP